MKSILEFVDVHSDLISILLTITLFIIGFLINRKTKKIQRTLTWKEFRDPVVKFSNHVISTLSESAALCDTDHNKVGAKEYWQRFSNNLTKLTSMIDQGRLVIPNLYLDDNSAYGGLRNNALDCIVAAYNISKAIDFEQAANNKVPTKNLENRQYKKITEALSKLPNQKRIQEIELDVDFQGWSCKYALIEVKRQYVNEISKLVQARQWVNDIRELADR